MAQDDLAEIIAEVLAELDAPAPVVQQEGPMKGVFATADDALSAARKAHETLVVMPLEKRREIIANIRKNCAANVRQLATLAVDETGLGRVEDKIKESNVMILIYTP